MIKEGTYLHHNIYLQAGKVGTLPPVLADPSPSSVLCVLKNQSVLDSRVGPSRSVPDVMMKLNFLTTPSPLPLLLARTAARVIEQNRAIVGPLAVAEQLRMQL
jgi:hypothetical protein